MITDPELDGGWEPARPAEVVQDTVVPGARAPRRPWPWVAAAVVATSALWAGGLYAFSDRTAEPEIRYRVTDDLCGQFKAPALEGLLGGLPNAVPEVGSRHPALDWAACTRGSDSRASIRAFDAKAEVELHKKTDPGAEFALDTPVSRAYVYEGGTWESVPGLGEEALVTRPPDGIETGGGLRLRVRDGGAVFTIDVSDFVATGEGGPEPRAVPPPPPDREALVAAAVEDARALMAALRTS
ncbi:hypothetical protein ACFWWM_25230 [Streptomyces sp. NPDC058682]|uniref:hypothetical protein n=1 Tax=unclassified Streptomyces TaxID=2593676 RepID=UPI0022555110|nr:hypothetical protein [Streptomyces sp. NBC_01214]MCX4805459.1 hypothetical protein [Streptomyces sp. NBC_01214]